MEGPQGMIQQINSDAQKIAELEKEIRYEQRHRKQYQGDAEKLEMEMAHIHQRIKNTGFTVVLIDGDGAKFRDEFLRDHENGAARAAVKLREAVKDAGYGDDILVRVFANVNDLARSLCHSGAIDYADSMKIFAEQFTNSNPSFDFVNVGKGKENADSKLRSQIRHYYRNVQCQKILIACCHDNGYLHALREYFGHKDDRIVLLETTPAEPGFKKLDFPIVRFDSVFRTESLNNETKHRPQSLPFTNVRSPPGFPQAPLGRPMQSMPDLMDAAATNQSTYRSATPSASSATTSPIQTTSSVERIDRIDRIERPQPPVEKSPKSPPPAPARTKSNIVSSGNGGTSISYATAGGNAEHQNVTVKMAKPKKQPNYAYYNSDQGRLDLPIQHPAKSAAQETYQAKFLAAKPSVLCNDHYLRGVCKKLNCNKTHDVKLNPEELAIHRYKARTSMCPEGPYCVDYTCYLSHHCPRVKCVPTQDKPCPFSNTAEFGDLHYTTKEQSTPRYKWTDGIDFPETL
ncbi:hypothetical protein GGR57DRAFT_373163 [Xylariaceae sp. FL1272]|nr:hypothetical protein GGR57DRAFT_373163 [Xylariaceae sp. FL1272]